eukprot:6175894-Pleurochrysis_carterae.AAC.2
MVRQRDERRGGRRGGVSFGDVSLTRRSVSSGVSFSFGRRRGFGRGRRDPMALEARRRDRVVTTGATERARVHVDQCLWSRATLQSVRPKLSTK